MVWFRLSFQINLLDENDPAVSYVARLFSPEAPNRKIKRFFYLDPVANIALETLFFNSKDIFTAIIQERREHVYHSIAVAALAPPPAAVSPAHPARPLPQQLCSLPGLLASAARAGPRLPSTFSREGS